MDETLELTGPAPLTAPTITRGELRVLDGTRRGLSHHFEGTVVLGRGHQATVRLDNPQISREHASVALETNGFLVKDLGSENGTWIDRSRIVEARVPPGTVVRVGHVHLLLEVSRKRHDVVMLEPEFAAFRTRSPAMLRALALAQRLAKTETPVLLEGETGTGKTTLARAIHHASARSRMPFEVLDCGGVAAGLAQSEWFGHVPGAYTGAARAHAGVFERANRGTVFLDEVGELSPELQPALLRVTEQQEVLRLGASVPTKVDVRLISATHRDLSQDVARGRFREDLFYRLNVMAVRMPSLRERLEDLPLLVDALLRGLRVADPGSIEGPNLARLEQHQWPGNVRELRNVLARAVVRAPAGARFADLVLTPEDVPEVAPNEVERPERNAFQAGKQAAVARFERSFLTELWANASGRLKTAARQSGIERTQLRRLLRKHHII